MLNDVYYPEMKYFSYFFILSMNKYNYFIYICSSIENYSDKL
jgi:hypothetical protein